MWKANVHAPMFLIQEIDWQYNDEIFYRSDNGQGGIPKVIYTTQDAAYAECKRLNAEQLKRNPDMPCGYEHDGTYPTVKEFYEVVEVELGG